MTSKEIIYFMDSLHQEIMFDSLGRNNNSKLKLCLQNTEIHKTKIQIQVQNAKGNGKSPSSRENVSYLLTSFNS